MGDCPDVEMRERLPDRVAELLSPADAQGVDAHVASCEMCAFELSVLRAARSALQRGRQVDGRRIALAVASATRATPAARQALSARKWIGWRAAASIALVAAGVASVAVWRNVDSSPRGTAVAVSQPVLVPGNTDAPVESTVAARDARVVTRGLSVAGGLSGLSDAELEALLGDIGTVDVANVAEPEDVIPAIGGVEGVR